MAGWDGPEWVEAGPTAMALSSTIQWLMTPSAETWENVVLDRSSRNSVNLEDFE